MAVAAIRTCILYICIIAAMRIMGKRQLGDLQPVELVVTLLIADLAAIPMQDTNIPLLLGLVPILILVSLELIFSGLMLKFPFVTTLISGKPVAVIVDGQIQQKELKRLRMSVEDLTESLRQLNIFNIEEVQYALVETNGKVSAVLKPANRPVTAKDMQVQLPDNGMPVVVVSDGHISDWALNLCNLDKQWVLDTLKQHNCPLQEVFLMTVDKQRQIYLVRKDGNS